MALIGDACHPMLPYVAQGTANAMEDAAVLAAAHVHLGCAARLAYVRAGAQGSGRTNSRQSIGNSDDVTSA